jgi:hypothetical protein
MLTTSDQAFGFGKAVMGGGDLPASVKSVSDRAGLAAELNRLGNSNGPTVIELQAGTYDFSPRAAAKSFTIRAKKLTIRAKKGNRVVLKNLQLLLDLERADDILIQDLAFYSDGTGPEDAILFDGTNGSRDTTSRVRITHCSFDGYKDIAIDSHSHRTLLLATIDRCLFFDSKPGMPDGPLMPDGSGKMFRPFVNRGAINIASVVLDSGERTDGNSLVTVAFNVFVNVWRRNPRVGFPGNFGDIFNNLVYHWGSGNGENEENNGTDTWNGMAVGNQGTAVIQANRFIPGSVPEGTNTDKTVLRTGETVHLDNNPFVDIGTSSGFPNQFDNGAQVPTGQLANFSSERTRLYSTVQLGQPPTVTTTANLAVTTTGTPNPFTWANIVTDAGPSGLETASQASPEKTSRNLVRAALGVTQI